MPHAEVIGFIHGKDGHETWWCKDSAQVQAFFESSAALDAAMVQSGATSDEFLRWHEALRVLRARGRTPEQEASFDTA